MSIRALTWLFVLALLVAIAPVRAGGASLGVRIKFDRAVQAGPYSGRVYVVLVPDGERAPEPRRAMSDWFNSPQMFSADVRDIAPGGSVTLTAQLAGDRWSPKPWADVAPGKYRAQAIARVSLDAAEPGQGPGDLYSEPVSIIWPPDDTTPALTLSKAVSARAFRETDRAKEVSIRSELLSKFHGRDVTLRAGVLLPEGWSAEGTQTYPAVYSVTGFGGDHFEVARSARRIPPDAAGRVIYVVPDATNGWGHSVFADSDNTGPWGRALIEELIPAVEKKFRGPAAGPNPGSRRYVTGVSSGGWSSLWLQITYPDEFNGVWSHVPDPVDFRDFQMIDLYAPDANMYTDSRGQRRPIARMGDTARLFYREFVRVETVLGPGGQIGSFEAVFSPRGEGGSPRPLFDRATGKVDPETARAWEKYDIVKVLEKNWPTLMPKLKGKLRVYAGEKDNFYLEGATRLLGAKLKELDPENSAQWIVEVVPGMAHTLHGPAWMDMFATALKNEAPAVSAPPAPSAPPAGDAPPAVKP